MDKLTGFPLYRLNYMSKEDEEKKDTASGIGGKLLQIASGALKGDPADVQPTPGITPPEPSPEQTMVNETPVQQTTKNGTTVVPLPLPVPGATKLVALPPSDVAKLDPEIKRHYIVDQFTKATRVEVAYV